jgi:hypothetical protein
VAEVALSQEGAGQSASRTFVDRAGNAATATVAGVNIDKTAPATQATTDRPPNAQGWYNGDVAVALAASDGLSGVAGTAYNLDGAGWVAYAGPVAVTTEGVHTLLYRSTDRAGNQEASRTLAVRIDTTAPEAWLRFDPATKDLVVVARDGTSGAAVVPVAAAAVAPATWTADDDDDDADAEAGEPAELRGAKATVQREGGLRAAPPPKVELRTHRLADAAGNTLTVVVKVRKTDSELKARVISLQYNDGAPVAPERNRLHVLWLADRGGQLKSLVQDVSQGHGQDRETVGAVYDAKDDESLLIISDEPRSRPTRTRKNGLVLPRLETDRGQLNIGY